MPIKVVQFGEGNFLRAFVDYAFHRLNQQAGLNAGIAIVQPIENGMVDKLVEQDGLYTLFLEGIKQDKKIHKKELITSVVKGINSYRDFDSYLDLSREEELEFIISNTTEAGIAFQESDTVDMKPPASFPAKLTKLLHERYLHFKGDPKKGLAVIPCELINYNSDKLKEIILKYIDLWKLEDGFKTWLLEHNTFHNTLVDRIVPGYPGKNIEKYNKELDYKDNLIVTAEDFFLWVIEGDEKLKKKLPFEKTDLDVKIVKNLQPYRTRKVRILNGAHTTLVPLSILYGLTTVKESVEDPFTGEFTQKAVYDEIIDTLEMDRSELNDFADEVFDRFRNPYIKHMLSSIALNSISKFKVRVLPSLLGYISIHHKIPVHLTYAFACLIRFYKGTWQGKNLPVSDSKSITEAFQKIWEHDDKAEIARIVLQNEEFWGADLTKTEHLTSAVAKALQEIEMNGIEKGFKNFSSQY